MFDAKDEQTIFAIRALRDVARERARPLVLWVGAGASRWCGYPGWHDLASNIHRKFSKTEQHYPQILASSALSEKNYPEVFRFCKDYNSALYNRTLVESFGPARGTPPYARFVDLLKGIIPLQIVTTNVDEALEKSLPGAISVQRTDVERVQTLVQNGDSFICKLHGSISSVESTVFTTQDYAAITSEDRVRSLLGFLFGECCVLFLGYGLGDDYLLRAVDREASNRKIFGLGPHFAVLAETKSGLPNSVRTLKYIVGERGDHRASVGALDIVSRARSLSKSSATIPEASSIERAEFLSAYFIADFAPPGIWQSSFSLEAQNESSGNRVNINIGLGFIDSELPYRGSTAMHDLTVGLICFDYVYLFLSDVGKVHHLLGSERFWTLTSQGALRFVHVPRKPAVIYADRNSVHGGDVGLIAVTDKGQAIRGASEEIRSQIGVVPGKESEAESLFSSLQSLVSVIDDGDESPLPELVRGTLLYPSVQQSLGLSESFLPSKIPKWNMFAVLRMAHVVSIAQICQKLRIPAARLSFGGDALISSAFSVAAANDWAEEVAGYVLSGRFNTDLGNLVFNDPSILTSILQFRETQDGILLRERIRQILCVNEAGEFVASVNAGLERNIPSRILEQARDKLSGLLIAHNGKYPLTAAIWNTIPNADLSLRLWKKRSLETLQRHCVEHRISTYDLCPCSSGEKLQFCCVAALKG